jgi:hypothetical protein
MPLRVRPISVGIAVTFFFGISVVGCLTGLAPFTCCKRALLGAAMAYIAGSLTVKAINAVLVNAIIENQMNQKQEKNGAGRD